MTDQWNDAARKAADDLQATAKFHEDILTDKAVIEIIAEHFTELRETYEKLVELAVAVKQAFDMRGAINLCRTVGMPANPEWEEKALEAQNTIAKSVIDPLVVAAIERSKE